MAIFGGNMRDGIFTVCVGLWLAKVQMKHHNMSVVSGVGE